MVKTAQKSLTSGRTATFAIEEALGGIDDSIAMLRILAQAMDNERTSKELITLEAITKKLVGTRDRLDRAM